jgi:hypothetical protein
MPPHFFWAALDIDYSTAIRADITAQDYSVAPRHWYIDARFRCVGCAKEFVWTAREQKTWFETYCFFVDSRPVHCRECRAMNRDVKQLRNEYDSTLNAARTLGSVEQKQRIVQIVDELEEYCLVVPDKMKVIRDVFRKQLANG